MDVATARGAIESAMPGIHLEDLQYLGEGDFCIAFLANREWVFRFARNADGARRIECEAALLPGLANTLSLRIPSVEHIAQDSTTWLPFVCYRHISGAELSRQHLRCLTSSARDKVAKDLARFLDELHSYSIEKARLSGVPEYHYPTRLDEDRKRIVSQTYPLMEPDVRQFCDRVIHEHLESGHLEYRPTLLHDDLSHYHILFDLSATRITGVIDFSDAIIGDPAQDLMYLYDDYGPEFVGLVLANMENPDHRPSLHRVHFYHEWHTLGRLLWAVENRSDGLIMETQRTAEAQGCRRRGFRHARLATSSSDHVHLHLFSQWDTQHCPYLQL